MPPAAIVRFAKLTWTTLWLTMMGQLAPRDRSGSYQRPASTFRQRISREPGAAYRAVADRYVLVVGLSCPWAHRTLVTRALKGLEPAIPVAIVRPDSAGVWQFDRPLAGCTHVPALYELAQPAYRGRTTVPIVWDALTRTIVNNESSEIITFLNSEFNEIARYADRDLYPANLAPEIDRWNDRIYTTVNNGVYRCGFAQSQAAYDLACAELFASLAEIDRVLAAQAYLCGDRVTLADVRLFTTLIRFDLVYYGLFKCNLRRIQDYEHLSRYLQQIYDLPGVAETCDFVTIKRDYYGSLFPLNPGGIIPLGPEPFVRKN